MKIIFSKKALSIFFRNKRYCCAFFFLFFSISFQAQIFQSNNSQLYVSKDATIVEIDNNSIIGADILKKDVIYISDDAFVFDEGNVTTIVDTNPPPYQKNHLKKNKKQLLVKGNREATPKNKPVDNSASNKNHYTLPSSNDFFSTGNNSLVFAPPSTKSFSFALIIFKDKSLAFSGINDRTNNHSYNTFYKRSYFNKAAAIRPPPFS